MLYTVDISFLKRNVNIDALQAAKELSLKYREHGFFFAAVNALAAGLPETATIIAEDEVPEIEVISKEYNTLINEKLVRSGAVPEEYDGLKMVSLDKFNCQWFDLEGGGFFVKCGEFFFDA